MVHYASFRLLVLYYVLSVSQNLVLGASSIVPSKAPSMQPMRTQFPTSPTLTPSRARFTISPTSGYFWWNSTIDKSILTSKDKNLDTMSMVYTLIINIVLFIFFLVFFEYNRHYKQIFLKRYQKRFIDIGQVPPQPSDRSLGWFFAIWSIPEIDVLHMVGLDAYMLLRYQAICIKVGLFLTFFGLIFLVPIYATADGNLTEWDRYTILNAVSGSEGSKLRVWATVLFAYVFAAYFCQVFYTEYDRFSTLRLSYLTKVDEVNPSRIDPDVMPQKEYTIMVEQIPSDLRSEHKLFEHFDDLFPGEVFSVEVALDLRELHKLVEKRKSIRGNLEMAIAHYLATHQRLVVNGYTRKMTISDILAFEEESNRPIYVERRKDFQTNLDNVHLLRFRRWVPLIKFVRMIQRDVFGYEAVDAVNYYTAMLIDLNNQVRALQGDLMDISKHIDVELQKRIKNKYDTRMAAALGILGAGGNSLLEMVEGGLMEPQSSGPVEHGGKRERRGSLKGKQRRRSIGSARDVSVPSAHPSTLHTRHPSRPRDSERVEAAGSEATLPPQSKPSVASEHTVELSSIAPEHEDAVTALERGDSGYLLVDHSLRATAVDSPAAVPADSATEHADDELHAETETHDSTSEVDSSHGGSEISAKPSMTSIWPVVSTSTATATVPAVSPLLVHQPSHDPEAPTADKPRTRSRSHSRSSTKGSPSRMSTGPLKSSRSRASTRHRRYSRTSQDDDEDEFKADESNRYTAELEKSASALIDTAKFGGREAWAQTKVAGTGALRGVIEAERAMEMILFGSYYKYSSTAFVTFKTRTAETITNQLMLDHDTMQIHHAPHPNDIIWDNIAIPRNQIAYRNMLTNIALAVGSIFWSSLVTAINSFARTFSLPENQQNLVSVFILLGCLLMLPFIFDILARNYECMKLESEIQNAIMTRYFWYQVVNYYVTVALQGIEVHQLLLNSLRTPQVFITLLGKTIPAVSLYFVNVVIVKIFIAVPVEMLRPWQLTSILTITNFTNKKKCTRRELRSGAFYAWPML